MWKQSWKNKKTGRCGEPKEMPKNDDEPKKIFNVGHRRTTKIGDYNPN
jgi:hypothetical protein